MPEPLLNAPLPISITNASPGHWTPWRSISPTSPDTDRSLPLPTTDSPDTRWSTSVNWQPGIDPKLSLQVLTRCLALLLKAFPTFALDQEFAWQMLGDLPEPDMHRAALWLIQTKLAVYPGTNWIAEIRHAATESEQFLIERHKQEMLHGSH